MSALQNDIDYLTRLLGREAFCRFLAHAEIDTDLPDELLIRAIGEGIQEVLHYADLRETEVTVFGCVIPVEELPALARIQQHREPDRWRRVLEGAV